jgi:2-polyprenyl-3-methyl-5-hydroxy-6-metoxy-1,4-benzoquinol methylase
MYDDDNNRKYTQKEMGKNMTEMSYYGHSREEMLSLLPQNRRRILEIGCGEGLFSGQISGAEEKWGVEPAEAAASAAKGRLTHVINKLFEEAKHDLPEQYFDLVICNDVIEHMTNHDKFLNDIKEYIAPGGVIVGSIPNVRYHRNLFNVLFAKDWEYTDCGILDRTHFRFFTEKSLRRSLSSAGFVIEELRGINGGIEFGLSKWKLAYSAFAVLSIVLSFGYFSDIKHLQFAFRARPGR